VGDVPTLRQTSALLLWLFSGKIRIAQPQDLEPGRYRGHGLHSAGLDIGTGNELDHRVHVRRQVLPAEEKRGLPAGPSSLMSPDLSTPKKTGLLSGCSRPGYLWVDDVSMERVGAEVKLTDVPQLGSEEAPIAPRARSELAR